MCLGDVVRVVELDGPARAVVQVGASGRRLVASLLTLDDPVARGDWLLVHSGFALSLLTPDAAADALAIRADPAPPAVRAPSARAPSAPAPIPAPTTKDLS